MLDTIPVELVAAIAFLACTDGGYTGCSLSLVSKYIRDASHPARFHSVSLASDPERMVKFLHTFQTHHRRLPDSLARVRHLFLSLRPIEGEPMQRNPPPQRGDIMRAYEEYITRLYHLGDRYGRTVSALIQAVAADLETLTCVRGGWKNIPTVSCAFPRLRELTLVDGYPEFLCLEDAPACRPLFPALEHLHVAEVLCAGVVDLRLWAPHAPALTHVRSSGLQHFSYPTISSLGAISARPPSDANENSIFPHLSSVFVQPSAVKWNMEFMQGGQEQLRAELAALAEQPRRGLQFVVLPLNDPAMTLPGMNAGSRTEDKSKTIIERSNARAKQSWLERVSGHEGCWSEHYVY